MERLHYNQTVALNNATQVRIPPQMERRLKSVSDRTGLPKSDLIRRAIEDYLDQVETQGCVDIQMRQPVSSDAGEAHRLAGLAVEEAERRAASRKAAAAAPEGQQGPSVSGTNRRARHRKGKTSSSS